MTRYHQRTAASLHENYQTVSDHSKSFALQDIIDILKNVRKHTLDVTQILWVYVHGSLVVVLLVTHGCCGHMFTALVLQCCWGTNLSLRHNQVLRGWKGFRISDCWGELSVVMVVWMSAPRRTCRKAGELLALWGLIRRGKNVRLEVRRKEMKGSAKPTPMWERAGSRYLKDGQDAGFGAFRIKKGLGHRVKKSGYRKERGSLNKI